MKNHKISQVIGYGRLYSNHLRPVYLRCEGRGALKPRLQLPSFAVLAEIRDLV